MGGDSRAADVSNRNSYHIKKRRTLRHSSSLWSGFTAALLLRLRMILHTVTVLYKCLNRQVLTVKRWHHSLLGQITICCPCRTCGSRRHLSVKHSAEFLWDALICLEGLIQHSPASAAPCVQGCLQTPQQRHLWNSSELFWCLLHLCGQARGWRVSRFYCSNVLIMCSRGSFILH